MIASILFLGCGRVDDATGDPNALIVTGHCAVSANGTSATGDAVSGAIHDDGTAPVGTWSNDSGDSFTGTASWLQCRVNGATVADFTGTGSWNGTAGYSFRVHVQDRGAPGAPVRVEGAPTTTTVTASRTYSPSRWTDGVATWSAGAYATIPSTLPVTTGNAGNHWAWITFAPDPAGAASLAYPLRCRYRGGAHGSNPTSAADIAAGLSYQFVDCQRPCSALSPDGGDAESPDGGDTDADVDEDHHHEGDAHGGHLYARGDDHHSCDRDDDDGEHDDWCTDPDVMAGAQLDVTSATVHVQDGSNRFPSRSAARTVVTVGFDVVPFVLVAPENDFYQIAIWDPSGTLVHSTTGDLASGDVQVSLLP